MHFSIYDVLYSQCSHQLFSVDIPVICRVMSLLQKYKRINLINCVTITP
jgi:hypothetical protein